MPTGMEALGRAPQTPANKHLMELTKKVSLTLLNIAYSQESVSGIMMTRSSKVVPRQSNAKLSVGLGLRSSEF